MSAFALFDRAHADGVSITATQDGNLEVRGRNEAIRAMAPVVRRYKARLIACLTQPHRLWLIHHADGRLTSNSYTPPATLEEVRRLHPLAREIEPEGGVA